MANSPIEWTDKTWNPITGCTKISPGCKFCYAEKLALRLQAMATYDNYQNGFKVTLQPQMLKRPLEWKKPCRIFVNSMSDIFHADIEVDYIKKIFSVMKRADHHIYQLLTKRPERLLQVGSDLRWKKNMWMGVSVENMDYVDRIDMLRQSEAKNKFLSLEPLLGPLPDLNLEGIGWVIVGGESGTRARPMKKRWIIDIRNQCRDAKVPFFFKQWGGARKWETGRELSGRTYDGLPKDMCRMLRLRG